MLGLTSEPGSALFKSAPTLIVIIPSPFMKHPFKSAALLASLALSAFAAAPEFRVPPLNDPATTTTRPGKFIWIDLFTADPAVSTKFYTELFGWQWELVGHGPQAYQIAYQNGLPIADYLLKTLDRPHFDDPPGPQASK